MHSNPVYTTVVIRNLYLHFISHKAYCYVYKYIMFSFWEPVPFFTAPASFNKGLAPGSMEHFLFSDPAPSYWIPPTGSHFEGFLLAQAQL